MKLLNKSRLRDLFSTSLFFTRCGVVTLLFQLFPSQLQAGEYVPVGSRSHICTQKGVTASNTAGKISLRSKNKKKLLEGRVSWTYLTLQKQINKTDKTLAKKKKKLTAAEKKKEKENKRLSKSLHKIMNILMGCYDAKQLPRPGVTAVPPATPTPIPPGTSVNFDLVSSILRSNCTSCHNTWTMSEAYFQEANLVRAGEPSQSTLYRILRENPEGYSGARMPAAGPALAQDQIAAIRQWISQLTPIGGPPPPDREFTCFESMKVAPSSMKRISRKYLENALIDLVDAGLHNRPLSYNIAWHYGQHEQSFVTTDYSELGHQRLDDRADGYYIEGVFRVIEGVAARLEGRMAQFVQGFVSTCSSSNYLTETCRNNFLRRFGRRVFKGGFTDAHYNFYRRPNPSGQSQATYREMITVLLSSPYFLYDLEAYGTPIDSTNLLLRLSPPEFIGRLAYTMWNTLPDEQLVVFAEDGTVENNPAEVVRYAIEVQAQKSYEGMKDFFEGWFRIRHLNDEVAQYMEIDERRNQILQYNFDNSDLPLITDFSDNNAVDMAMRGYKTAAINEVPEIGSILTLTQPAPVSELFRTRVAAPRDPVLARAYNLTAAWDGDLQNIPQTPVTRSGILTRPAWHFARGPRKRPVIIASHLRRDLLCDSTGLPTDNSTPPQVDIRSSEYSEGTTQERLRLLTERSDTNCASCHLRLINPLGFAMDDFDMMGRRRSNGLDWYLAAPWNQALRVYLRPYDRHIAPRINRNDDTPVEGTVGLGERIASSPEMRACFVRNAVRFSLRRAEVEAGDGCFMNKMFDDSANLSMKQVWTNMFLSPEFRMRRLDEAFP